MPSRKLTFTQRPWQGGLNTAIDPALLSPDELVRAENCLFATNGSRKRRAGLGLWDYMATGVQKSSSGVTRTLVLDVNAGFTMSIGDAISVRTSAGLDTDYDVQRASVTNVDAVTYSPNVAVTYDLADSLTEALNAATDIKVGTWSEERIIGVYDYWYFQSGNKLQKIVSVSSTGNFYEHTSSGSKSVIATDVLTLSGSLTDCSFATLANKLIIAFNGAGNLPVIWDGSTNLKHLTNTDWENNDIQSTNPTPSLEKLRLHQQRLYATVSGDPDRIHYSGLNNPEQWNGEGDSGALEVAIGDGDSTGFSAIFPSFKGRLGVAKGNKLYQIIGYAPLQSVDQISDGIGCESHGACVAVDQDDVVFISRRGIHSFSATDQFGDFSGGFLSQAIQPDFNALNLSKVGLYNGQYMPEINSVLFVVEEAGQTSNNAAYLFNILTKTWYFWKNNNPDFLIDSSARYKVSGTERLLLGLSKGRILEYNNDNEYDFVDSSVRFDVESGVIYPDQDISKIKGFKNIGILYKTERDSVDFDVSFRVDNFQDQDINVTQTPEGDLLGSTFLLGSSVLGFTQILLPEYLNVDGYGFGCKIRITSLNPIEIYGYTIDFEPAGDQQDVIR